MGKILVACWAVLTLTQQALADEPVASFTVLATGAHEILVDGKPLWTTKQGDMLTVVRLEKDSFGIRGEKDRLGWIQKGHVVKLEDSLPFLSELIKKNPQDPRWYALRGFASWTKDDPNQAVQDLTRAIDLGDTRAWLFEYRGMASAVVGDFKTANDDYSKALKMGRSTTSLYANRAAAQLALGLFPGSIQDYTEVIKREPNRTSAYYQRAVAHRNSGDLEKAIADFDSALKINPKYVEALNGRGFAYFQKGDQDRAIADFTKVIEIEPQSALAYNNRGYNRFLKGNYQGALGDYQEAVKLSPEYTLAYQNVAWLYATAGDESVRNGELAVKAALQACELNKYKDSGDVRALAAAYAEAGKFTSAVEWQTKAIQLLPEENRKYEQEILERYRTQQPPLRNVALSTKK
jgi:tetratricopeptide (TPR) repeat protein